MAIRNLLSLTVRKNLNYEPEALSVQAYCDPTAASSTGTTSESDSLSINGRVMDIMGSLTDEQIEAVFKVGYNNAVNQMAEIITTCKDISDEELINIFLGATNPTSSETIPPKLRIIRPGRAEAAQAAEIADEKSDEAIDWAQKAKEAAENAETSKGTDNDAAQTYADNAVEYAKKAREAADQAISEADKALNEKNATEAATEKAKAAKVKAEQATALADAAEALAKAVIATIVITEAQNIMIAEESKKAAGGTVDLDNIQTAVDKASEAKKVAIEARQNAKDATDAANKIEGTDDLSTSALAMIDSIICFLSSGTETVEDEADHIIDKASSYGITPSEDPEEEEEEDGEDEDPTLTADYTLKRKCTSGDEICVRENITVDATGTTFKLTNSVKSKKFKYTISANDGTTATITKIEFLDNDRLFIVGDNLKIVADDGQCDNIILMGRSNYIDTGDLNDTIRVGFIQDSSGASQYYNDLGDGTGKKYRDSLIGNTIKSGSGNDYVEICGYQTVDMGGDSGDYFYDVDNDVANYVEAYGEGNTGYVGKGSYTTYIEVHAAQGCTNTYQTGSSQTSDYTFGVANQGGYGDCQFLTFMNTFNGNLSDYISITSQSDGYKVTFTKSGYSATVTNDEINNNGSDDDDTIDVLNKLLYKSGSTTIYKVDKENASGDIDNVLVEIAFRKVIANITSSYGVGYNMDNYDDGESVKYSDGNTYKVYNADENGNIVYTNSTYQAKTMFGTGDNNNLISKVFYNTDGSDWYDTEDADWFKDILNAYKSGKITNIIVGTHQEATTKNPATGEENNSLGIYYNHAYAIKDFKEDEWVEVCNPWDGADRIRLDWDDFFKYYPSLILVGDSYQYMQNNIATSKAYAGVTLQDSNSLFLNLGGSQLYSSDDGALNSSNIFANIFASSEPTIYDEIDEITQSIESIKETLTEPKRLRLIS